MLPSPPRILAPSPPAGKLSWVWLSRVYQVPSHGHRWIVGPVLDSVSSSSLLPDTWQLRVPASPHPDPAEPPLHSPEPPSLAQQGQPALGEVRGLRASLPGRGQRPAPFFITEQGGLPDQARGPESLQNGASAVFDVTEALLGSQRCWFSLSFCVLLLAHGG